jgi:transposase
MRHTDARSLSAEAQEDLRRKAVEAVRRGMTQGEAAGLLGVARGTVNLWCKTLREGGSRALRSKPRGRPRGTRLGPEQAREIVRLIADHHPEQLRLPFVLWTREAVGLLIEERLGLSLSVWTVGRHLRRWGLTPQKPLRRAYERDPEAVRRWLANQYPAIRREAKRKGALIHWGDEMGLRSDHTAGRSWGLRGQTPVVPGPGRRFGCNMISAITNQGHLSFMVFRRRFSAAVLIEFLRRLVRQAKRLVFVILDRHPVHRAQRVKQWLAAHRHQLRLFFLPPYSPDLNPDELLNNDVKANAVGRRRARDEHELTANLRGYLRSTQRQPAVVRNFFEEPHVRYAAA